MKKNSSINRWTPAWLYPLSGEPSLVFLVLASPILLFPDWFLSPLKWLAAVTVLVSLSMAGRYRLRISGLWLVGFLTFSVIPPLLVAEYPPAAFEKGWLFLLGIGAISNYGFSSMKRDPNRFVAFWTTAFIAMILLVGLAGPFFADLTLHKKLFGLTPVFPALLKSGERLDANILATLLGAGLPICLVAAITPTARFPKRHTKVVKYLVVAVFGLLLLATQSRAALIASGFISAIVVFVIRYQNRKMVQRVLCIVVLGVVLSPLLAVGLALQNPASMSHSGITYLPERIEVWSRATFALQSCPLTGIGIGQFDRVVPSLFPFFLFSPQGLPRHAHNLYLQIALDIGIPGLVAMLALVCYALTLGVLALGIDGESRGRSHMAWILPSYLGAILIVLLHGAVDSTLWLNKPHMVLFFLLGMTIYLARTQLVSGTDKKEGRARPDWRQGLRLVIWLLVSFAAVSLAEYSPLLMLGFGVSGGAAIGVEAACASYRDSCTTS